MEVEIQDEAKAVGEISKDVRAANLHPNKGDELALQPLIHLPTVMGAPMIMLHLMERSQQPQIPWG